jgi:arginine decarboxylase
MIPTKVFFTKGVGRHKEKLRSFELALRDAGIEKYNLVRVSSILPPGCEIISKEEGLKLLKPGQIVYCVLSENTSNEPNHRIVASIGCAIPLEKDVHGYLSEHHSSDETEEKAGRYAETLATCMLATTLGMPFDPEKEQGYGKVKTTNISQSALVENGWTTVIAAAVFILSEL